MVLSGSERDALDFEATDWARSSTGAREHALRELLGHTGTRHAQILVSLVGRPEAWAYAPATMRRLEQRVHGGRLRRLGVQP